MSEIYDSIAKKYHDSKTMDIVKAFDYSLLQKIGDVKNKTILDLACGDGHFSRILRHLGCKKVVGVDISSEMINLAKDQEIKENLGIEYICSNVSDLGVLDEFDIVIGVHLLHYASDENELNEFSKAIYNNLKSRGHFITLSDSGIAERFQNDTRVFGYNFSEVKTPLKNGDTVELRIFSGGGEIKFPIHYYSEYTYIKALEKVGFQQIERANLQVPINWDIEKKQLWKNFSNECHLKITTCIKP